MEGQGLPIRLRCKPLSSSSSSVTPGAPEQAPETEPAAALKLESTVVAKEKPKVEEDKETGDMADVKVFFLILLLRF